MAGRGGRPKGSPNKRTVEAIEQASREIGNIRKQGRKRAVEVLDEFMFSVGGMAAMYQNRIIAPPAGQEAVSQADVEMFKWAVEMTEKFAKALAPFQSPTYRAINVTVGAGDIPPPTPAQIADQGKTIDDPQALMRFYQANMKRIA
jgi:hypothetical protein